MGFIYGWVKNILCFYIFLTAAMHLLPRGSYQKYVRFFCGLLLVILVITPILDLFGEDGALLEKVGQEEFFQEIYNIRLDTKYLEQGQKEAYIKQYEEAIEMDVGRMARQRQMMADQVTVRLNGEYEVESIQVRARPIEGGSPDGSEARGLKQELMEFYQIGERQVEIVEEGG